MSKIKPIIGTLRTISRIKHKHGRKLAFDPKPSKITIDLNPEKFKHSEEFSKMMDSVHRRVMHENLSYGA